MRDDQLPSQEKTRLAQSWSNIKCAWHSLPKWTKRITILGGFIGALGTAVGYLESAYSFIFPNVEIHPGTIADDNDPMSAEFVIFNNNEHFSLIATSISCEVKSRHFEAKIGSNIVVGGPRDQSQFIQEIKPKKSVTRNCGRGMDSNYNQSYPATFKISISSKWPSFWPILPYSTYETFVGIKNAQGHPEIQPDAD
jgi:hypothetical protein